MNTVFVLAIIAIAIFFIRKRHKDSLIQRYSNVLARYNSHAFKSTNEEIDKDFIVCTRLADELVSSGGKRAVALATSNPRGGTPLQEINKNGTFSSRPPYFVSRYSNKWHRNGARHVIQTVHSKTSVCFKTSNQKPGATAEIGTAILEYNTDKFPPATLSDMHYMTQAAETNEELRRLLTARINGEHYFYNGSPLNQKFMFGPW